MENSIFELFEIGFPYKYIYNTIDILGKSTSFSLSNDSSINLQLAQNGYSSIHCSVSAVDLLVLNQFSSLRVDIPAVDKSVADHGLFAQMLEKLLALNPKLRAVINKLLLLYSIDEVNVLFAENSVNNGSDFWHRDGVGHRIKILIPIQLHGSPPATELFSGSHLYSCHPMIWEMLRIGEFDPNTKLHQDLISSFYKRYHGNFLSFEWSNNNVLFLDTNSVHRAGNFSSGTSGSWRQFFSIELIDPIASKIAFKYKLGECFTKRNKKLINTVYAICR